MRIEFNVTADVPDHDSQSWISYVKDVLLRTHNPGFRIMSATCPQQKDLVWFEEQEKQAVERGELEI